MCVVKGEEMEALRRFLRDESSLETVEWSFILGFVVLVVVLSFMRAQASLTTIFTEMVTELDDAATFGGS